MEEPSPTAPEFYPVFINGAYVGRIPESRATALVEGLRKRKVLSSSSDEKADKKQRLPSTMEITLIASSPDRTLIQTQFPGVYVFSEAARLIRPVRHLGTSRVEWIGTFEQVCSALYSLGICLQTA